MKKQIYIQKNEKLRNPNIDFIRILGMYSIVIHHLLGHGNAIVKFGKFNELKLLNIIGKWHVSSFGLVSGIIGNNETKFSKLFYLWILVVFYSFIFFTKYSVFHINSISNSIFISNLFPVIHQKYWYFTAYFGIYPFLPFINKSMILLTELEIKKIIYFIFGVFIILASYSKDCFHLNSGYSAFSLFILYILGAYIAKFHFKKINNNFYK